MKTQNIFSLIGLILVLTVSSVYAISETVYLDDYEVTYSYSAAEEDETFTLGVTINNTGDAKNDVLFEFNEDNPFEIDSDVEWDIGSLASGEVVSKSFRVSVEEGTSSGNYNLEFSIEDSEDEYDDDFEIDVSSNEADLIIGGVVSSPLTIMADQNDVKIEVTIQNIGDSDAEFVLATLNLPAGFEKSDSYSDFANLGTIAAKQSKTAIFFVDVAKNAATENRAEVSLEYRSDSERKTDKLFIDLPVKGKPSYEIVSSQVSPSRIYAGSEGTLEISIRNVGEKLGEETSVRIFENTDIPIEFNEKTKFIGDLGTNDVGNAVFSINVQDSAAASTYLVKMQVRSVSGDSVLTEEYNVPVIVSKKEGNSMNYLIYGGIAVLIVLVIVLIWAFRKK